MTPKPLTAPLAQIALANTRPSPPSSRPMRIVPPTAVEPDRQHVDKPAREAAEVATKKKMKRRKDVGAEARAAAVARVAKLIEAGKISSEATSTVAKELGVSDASVYAWRRETKKGASNGEGKTPSPELNGLDLVLDIIELCERAKKGLTKAQRARLRASLNERLS